MHGICAYNVQYEYATNGHLSPFFMRKLGAFRLLKHEAHSTLKPDAILEQIDFAPGHILYVQLCTRSAQRGMFTLASLRAFCSSFSFSCRALLLLPTAACCSCTHPAQTHFTTTHYAVQHCSQACMATDHIKCCSTCISQQVKFP